MKSLQLEISEEVLREARIPPDEVKAMLYRELAVQLYSRGLLPKAAAQRLGGMERIAFDDLLGQRGVVSPLTFEEVESDLRNLDRLLGGPESSSLPEPSLPGM